MQINLFSTVQLAFSFTYSAASFSGPYHHPGADNRRGTLIKRRKAEKVADTLSITRCRTKNSQRLTFAVRKVWLSFIRAPVGLDPVRALLLPSLEDPRSPFPMGAVTPG